MKVKIGNAIFDSNDTPIMVIMEQKEKQEISNMPYELFKYCSYPEHLPVEEMEEWALTDKPTDMGLHGTINAVLWQEKWMEILKEHPNIPNDEGTMIGWFANAIMTGYDAAREKYEITDAHDYLTKDTSNRDEKNEDN